MLNYFGDNLVNVGPPEALMEWNLNDVTLIKNEFLKCELIWIKNMSQIQ